MMDQSNSQEILEYVKPLKHRMTAVH